MFGYVKIYKPDMRVREYETYKSVYCTLCRVLCRRYGPLASALLSYDYTFVAMIRMAINEQCPECVKGRCVYNPLRSCGRCTNGSESFDFCAALTVIMFYYKCVDNIRDSGAFGKVLWWVIKTVARPMRAKAARLYPELDACVAEYIEQQRIAEHSSDISVDMCAEPTAKALSRVLSMLSEDEKKKRVLGDFGYYIGRWIYIIDACDDLESDLKKSVFNPIAAVRGLSQADAADEDKIYEARVYANQSMNMTLARAVIAYNLLELGAVAPIMDNVIHTGMAQSQKRAMHEKELQVNE